MYCFTRKTLVGANRVRIHFLRVKPIVLRVKPYFNVLRVKQTRTTIFYPFGHKLQITLINLKTFYA